MRRLSYLVVSLVFLAANSLAEEPAKSSVESKFLSNIRQVTSGMVKAGEGYFSPDGKTIIYQAVPQDYPFYQIFTQQLAGGKPKLVSTGRGRTTCSNISPDGKKILFASSHLDPKMNETEATERKQQEADKAAGVRRRYKWDFDPYSDIFEADLDGHILRRLTDAKGYDAEGAWSKDGKLIAYCSSRDGDPDIYVMNSDGGEKRQLTDAPGYDGGPFISPDGKWVVFRSDRKSAEHLQLYVIGIDGKHEQALTDDANSVHWGPYWHPSQTYIIWSGADHSDPNARPNYDLWLVKYEIKENKFILGPRMRVTDAPGGDVLPVFSPDGKKLMWTSTRTEDHQSQLFIADFKLPE
jgi:Tol biopolymer transport system component